MRQKCRELQRQVLVATVGNQRSPLRAAATSADAMLDAADVQRNRTHQADDAGRSHRARADVEDVAYASLADISLMGGAWRNPCWPKNRITRISSR